MIPSAIAMPINTAARPAAGGTYDPAACLGPTLAEANLSTVGGSGYDGSPGMPARNGGAPLRELSMGANLSNVAGSGYNESSGMPPPRSGAPSTGPTADADLHESGDAARTSPFTLASACVVATAAVQPTWAQSGAAIWCPGLPSIFRGRGVDGTLPLPRILTAASRMEMMANLDAALRHMGMPETALARCVHGHLQLGGCAPGGVGTPGELVQQCDGATALLASLKVAHARWPNFATAWDHRRGRPAYRSPCAVETADARGALLAQFWQDSGAEYLIYAVGREVDQLAAVCIEAAQPVQSMCICPDAEIAAVMTSCPSLLVAWSRHAESVNVVPTMQGVQHFLWTNFVALHELDNIAATPLSAKYVALEPSAAVPWCMPNCPYGGSVMCLPPTRHGRGGLGPIDTTIPTPRRIRHPHPCERCGTPMQGDWTACTNCPTRPRPVRRFTTEVWTHKLILRCPGIATREFACRNWDRGCKVTSTDPRAILVETLPIAEYQTSYTDAMFRGLQGKATRVCEAELRLAKAGSRPPQFTEAVRLAVGGVPNHPELYAAAVEAGIGGSAEDRELDVARFESTMAAFAARATQMRWAVTCLTPCASQRPFRTPRT